MQQKARRRLHGARRETLTPECRMEQEAFDDARTHFGC